MKPRFAMTLSLFLTVCFACAAQTSGSDEERRQKTLDGIYEAVEKQVEIDTRTYGLADWQVFKIDSTLVHDYIAMLDESEALSKKGVGKSDYYQKIQDKWFESIYNSYMQVLDDEQRDKYLKAGAARDKKKRDKRAGK